MSAPGHAGSPRRVVLDTNVLVSLFVFDDARYGDMLARIDSGRWQAFTNEHCLTELRHVLARPMFGLDDASQTAAFARWRRMSTCCAGAGQRDYALPVCRDADDQKFLELARAVAADWLVTDDKALLVLGRRQKLAGKFRILTPQAAMAES